MNETVEKSKPNMGHLDESLISFIFGIMILIFVTLTICLFIFTKQGKFLMYGFFGSFLGILMPIFINNIAWSHKEDWKEKQKGGLSDGESWQLPEGDRQRIWRNRIIALSVGVSMISIGAITTLFLCCESYFTSDIAILRDPWLVNFIPMFNFMKMFPILASPLIVLIGFFVIVEAMRWLPGDHILPPNDNQFPDFLFRS